MRWLYHRKDAAAGVGVAAGVGGVNPMSAGKKGLEDFRNVLSNSVKIVAFTGAGISTESGIPDYRSKGGIWDNFQPVYFDEFLKDADKRLLYWQRKEELWTDIKNATPNSGHLFFKKLYDLNKLKGLITQNIDGLHEKSGLPKEIIVNLHGTNLEVICLSCSSTLPASAVFDSLDLSKGVPLCDKCGGLLKPNTISFGQQLRSEDIERANALALDCDLFIAVGSTLLVQPAASYPMFAKRNKAKLAIITLSETPLDTIADFLFNEKLSDFLSLLNF
ncbi:silent information regulator protein Sir2 [Candidatus Magnetoovum chiemensis]|nr:silent information regulator protein Sir2 [Candidatus Magnetoovum chiemensis]